MWIEFIVATEASLLPASWFRRARMRRQEILLGGGTHEIKNLPILDEYIKRHTGTPTRLQTIAAQKVAAACRRAVHTRAFEYLILKLVQSVVHRSRRESGISKVEVVL